MHYPTSTDTRLVAAAQRGDHRAADEIVTRNRPYICKLSARWRVPGLEQGDLTQELSLAILTAIERYVPGRGATFHTYMRAVIYRRYLSTLRSATTAGRAILTNAAEHDAEQDAGCSAGHDDIITARELRAEFDASLAVAFSLTERRLFWLVVDTGCTATELAQRFGMSHDRARRTVRRCREHLSSHNPTEQLH